MSVVLLRDGTLSGLRTLSLGLGQVGGFTAFLQELRWTLLALGQDGPLLPARFFLCGGGACIGQLRDELERTLDTTVIPVQHLTLPAVPESYRESQGLFAVSLGLGFHEAVGGTGPRINLRCGEFAYQGRREARRREWGRLGWIAASVAAAAGLALAVDMYRLHTRYETLRHEIRRVFAATLPGVQTIVNEKLQLQNAVSTLQQRQQLVRGQTVASPLELLRQLSSALPAQVKLDLDEWVFDGEAVRLRGTTDSFDSAESIKTAAARLVPFREVQLKDVKAAPGGERISFNLHLFVDQQGN